MPKGSPSPILARLEGLAQAQRKGKIASWMEADPDELVRTICAASEAGGALRFGTSRDGGAYAVGVYVDDTRETLYLSPDRDVNEWLREIAGIFVDSGDGVDIRTSLNGRRGS